MSEEFARQEAEKMHSNQSQNERIVYDCIDWPIKREGDNTPYLDENDLIELPPDENALD